MPYFKITSNSNPKSNKTEFLSACSTFVAGLLKKSENFIMIEFNHNADMLFSGTNDPLVYVELKSIALPVDRTTELSSKICFFINDAFGIPEERIYIEFSDVERSRWGWNSRTFEK